MREILFKAKRKDNGEWVEGTPVFYKDGSMTLIDVNEYKSVGYHILNNGYLDRNTLCQYTGLTDKTGNKIWENDIVRGHSNPDDLAKVVFGEFYVIEVESFEKVDLVVGWHTEVIQTDDLSKCEPFCLPMPLTDFYISISEWEVIGNIFDNPELMEGGAE